MPKGKAKGPDRSISGPAKARKLPAKPITDKDAKSVKGGVGGVKKTMQTQV